MSYSGRGRYTTEIDLLDTPLQREGKAKVTFYVYGWYSPRTYWEPEDSGCEVEGVDIEGLSDGDARILDEFLMDKEDDYLDWGNIDWEN